MPRSRQTKLASKGKLDPPPAGNGSVRTFVEVLSPGDTPGSLADRKLQFTRRVLFLARRWKHQMDDALRQSGDSHARWITLVWVELLDGKANHRELAERVDVELPTLVRLLNRLEAEQLVKRKTLGPKGRAKSVVLTAKGRASLAAMSEVVNRTRATFLASLDEQQLASGLDAMDTLLSQYATVVDWRGRERRPR